MLENFLLILVSLIVGLATGIYLYMTKNFRYWQRRGIPGPEPSFPTGTMAPFFKRAQHDQIWDWKQQFGKIFGIYNGRQPALVVADMESLKKICIKDFNAFVDRQQPISHDEIFRKMLIILCGDEWRRMRSLLSPTFTSARMKRMYSLIDVRAKHFIDRIQTCIQKQGTANHANDGLMIKEMYRQYTLDVIARCAFGLELNMAELNNEGGADSDNPNPFFKYVHEFFNPDKVRLFLYMTLPKWLLNITGIRLNPPGMVEYFQKSVEDIVAQRRAQVKARGHDSIQTDYLQLLVDAQEDQDVHNNNNPTDDATVATTGNQRHGSLTLTEIAAQCVLFLAAGFETPTISIMMISYLLAANQEFQRKLYESIMADERVKYDPNTKRYCVDYDTLMTSLPYLDAVISEGLRLYPPGDTILRECVIPYELPMPDDSGKTISIEKGTNIFIPIYAVHRDADLWPEPHKFDPERFIRPGEIIPGSWIPFGMGPRHCIAQRFAMMELKSALLQLVTQFEICFPASHDVNKGGPTFSSSNGTMNPDPIMLTFKSRQQTE